MVEECTQRRLAAILAADTGAIQSDLARAVEGNAVP